MLRTNEIIDRLRRTKVRLARGGTVRRTLVPLVEAFEVWLSDGFDEVVVRARMRLAEASAPLRSTEAVPR